MLYHPLIYSVEALIIVKGHNDVRKTSFSLVHLCQFKESHLLWHKGCDILNNCIL